MEKRLKIMVIDDEKIVGKRLKVALEKAGDQIEIFHDPRDAVQRLEEQDFDIVVTDIRMEEIDGIEVLSRVLERSPRTRVIIITGYATVEMAREAQLKGAFDFIAKPFTPNDLRAVISRAAEQLRREVRSSSG